MKYQTIEDAARAWVMEMNYVPMGVVEKLCENNSDEITEITPLTLGADVYVYIRNSISGSGEVVKKLENGKFAVKLHKNGKTYNVDKDCMELDSDTIFPMSGMWAFSDSFDNEWIEKGGLEKMAECGFRIYEQEDYKYIFGIDGCGYSFLEEHWIPLYKARGLHWHESEVIAR